MNANVTMILNYVKVADTFKDSILKYLPFQLISLTNGDKLSATDKFTKLANK